MRALTVGVVLMALLRHAAPAIPNGADARTPPVRVLVEDIGIGTQTGFTPLLMRGSVLPAAFVDDFGTSEDNQVRVELAFSARDSATGVVRPLRTIMVDSIPPAPRGTSRVTIAVRVDEAGTVSVTALIRATARAVQAPLGAARTSQQ